MRQPAETMLGLLILPLGALSLLLSGCGGGVTGTVSNPPPPPPGPPPMLALASFVTGLSAPVGFEAPGDGTNRLFVIEQGGAIRIIQNGSLLATPFLDLRSKVESGDEKGLLGLAFHPNFTANRRFFVDYTRLLRDADYPAT